MCNCSKKAYKSAYYKCKAHARGKMRETNRIEMLIKTTAAHLFENLFRLFFFVTVSSLAAWPNSTFIKHPNFYISGYFDNFKVTWNNLNGCTETTLMRLNIFIPSTQRVYFIGVNTFTKEYTYHKGSIHTYIF